MILSVFLTVDCYAVDFKFGMQNYPPFNYSENVKPAGPAVEILMAVCAELKKTCEIKILPFRRVFYELDNGTLDGAFPLFNTPERREKYYMTQPMLNATYGFFVRKDSTWTFDTPYSLRDKTIATYGPSGSATTAQDLAKMADTPRFEMEVLASTMLRKLSEGRYGDNAVGFIALEVGAEYIKKEGISNLKTAGAFLKAPHFLALSRKTVTEADANQFDKTLEHLKTTGVINAILTKYHLPLLD
jgi:polar amino acid transport system substrate-binding protein